MLGKFFENFARQISEKISEPQNQPLKMMKTNMFNPNQPKNTTTPTVKNSINWSPLRCVLFLTTLALACFALSPAAQAVTPAPDGGYPNNNTAEGDSALLSLTTGADNTAVGYYALSSNTTGNNNTATGLFALESNTTGGQNTATGESALFLNTTGEDNTAVGYSALFWNTTGNVNTATGDGALYNNTTGSFNTANGTQALFGNTTGTSNTATSASALFSNTTGTDNVANGFNALLSNTTGGANTADGVNALFSNTIGAGNTATGVNAMFGNTRGYDDTAYGVDALYANTTGAANAGFGNSALGGNTTGIANTAIGGDNPLGSNTTGNQNIAVGTNAGSNLTTGDYNIDIGNRGVGGEGHTIRIGDANQTATIIAGISGTAVSGVGVVVDSNGQLGVLVSSERFKDAIQPMGEASEALLSLRPVTFHYKKNIDSKSVPQFGLVAEDVEKVDPALVTRDAEGKAFTVRYDAVNAMLLNEFLKEHKKVEELEATVTLLKTAVAKQEAVNAEQRREMEIVTAHLKEQDAKIQKVSDKVELSKPAPRTVDNQ